MNRRAILLCAILLASPLTASAQNVDVKVHTLENGLKVLMVPRRGDPNISAGWIAKVGSVNERPGITGIAHLFEHMMFKGTRTIGTSDIEKDLRTLAKLDSIKGEMQKEEEELVRRLRAGEIDDVRDPAARSARHQELRKEFEELLKAQKTNIVKDEFDKIYKINGASGMNAGTSYDFTIYFVNVPANKLELWFWMESDRLYNPVFREFYSERNVVREERRLRVESTPTGKFEEQFDALFWGSSPYSWPVIGWPSDLKGITRDEALAFFEIYYAPNNLTAALVGDFDADEAKALAERYFGRLQRGERPASQPRTREMPQLGEKRMTAYAETNPQVTIRYHSVPDGHVDEPALVVLGQILNGRTGRLYKALVEEQQVATNASGGQAGFKFEGMFSLRGTAKEGHTPEEVEQALYAEIERLKIEPVELRELQKVKNQNAASTFRELRANFMLMNQLLVREAYRGWGTINSDPPLYDAVSAEDIMRVASTYFEPETRAVAIYHRQESDEAPDLHLEGLDEQERQQVSQMTTMIGQMDTEQLAQFMGQLEEMAAHAPPEQQDMVSALREIARERQAASGGGR